MATGPPPPLLARPPPRPPRAPTPSSPSRSSGHAFCCLWPPSRQVAGRRRRGRGLLAPPTPDLGALCFRTAPQCSSEGQFGPCPGARTACSVCDHYSSRGGGVLSLSRGLCEPHMRLHSRAHGARPRPRNASRVDAPQPAHPQRRATCGCGCKGPTRAGEPSGLRCWARSLEGPSSRTGPYQMWGGGSRGPLSAEAAWLWLHMAVMDRDAPRVVDRDALWVPGTCALPPPHRATWTLLPPSRSPVLAFLFHLGRPGLRGQPGHKPPGWKAGHLG